MGQGSTVYTVETMSHKLEVFGEPENGWYGWRLLQSWDGRQVADDMGQGYGSFHTALREGLEAAHLIED